MKTTLEFAPSMMCADFGNLRSEVSALEAAGAEIFHIDIMDGTFVDNFGMGRQDIEYLRKATQKPLDAHLMVDAPYKYLEYLLDVGIDIFYIHPESCEQDKVIQSLKKIMDSGKVAGLAVNPDTTIEDIEMFYPYIERLLLMRVVPGFAGQQPVTRVEEKIEELVNTKDKHGLDLVLDGAVGADVIEYWAPKGVKGFVMGTSVLFGKQESYTHILSTLRDNIQKQNN